MAYLSEDHVSHGDRQFIFADLQMFVLLRSSVVVHLLHSLHGLVCFALRIEDIVFIPTLDGEQCARISIEQ